MTVLSDVAATVIAVFVLATMLLSNVGLAEAPTAIPTGASKMVLLTIRTKVSDVGTSKIQVPISHDGAPITLTLDPRYVSNADRLANQESLVTEIERALSSRTVDEWVDRLLAEGIPCGPILDYAQVFDSPHTAARRMVEVVDHPVDGPVRTLGIPVKLSDTPASVRQSPPLLGQHTADVLDAIAANRSPWRRA
jgi:hypothetical protein